jgi:hypothetical protein
LRGLGADGSHGTDGHIVELWWDSNGWHYNEHYNDLTARTGAPLAVGPPTGYVFDAQGTQHVIYRAAHGQQRDRYIVELWWDSNGWHYNDLNTAAGGAPLAIGRTVGQPTGYVFDAQGTQHVVYLGLDGHIVELWWESNGWHYNDLTAAIGAPL